MGKELARAAIAALHFVGNQQRAGFCGESAQALQEIVSSHAYAAHALNRLNNHGGIAARGEGLLSGGNIVEVCEIDLISHSKRRPHFGIVGGGHSAGGASVEGFAHG